MKNNTKLVDRDDLLEFNSHMVTWRDYIPKPDGDDFINYPTFDPGRPEEDDIYIYAGYVKPGVHDIIIYEPFSKKFYKLKNFVVFPRVEDIKYTKPAVSTKDAEDLLERQDALEYHGTNYKVIKSFLYGSLLRDQSFKVSSFCF